MKIAIVSDSHDNIINIEKFLTWAEKQEIDIIIHCGDIAAPSVIKELFSSFGGDIHLVHGNVSDRESLEKTCSGFKNITLHGDEGKLELDERKIAFCHFPEQAQKLAETGDYQLVFYGHTHKPWMETLANKSQLINPGTLGGLFQTATFAVYDTQKGTLVLKEVSRL